LLNTYFANLIPLELGGAFNPDVFFNTLRAETRVTKGGAKIPKWPEKESTVDTVNCK
jgi:hypothetical protein